ncbi:MAG: hypothetical protein J6W75_05260 [Bacteroidaceae bacterium]|nr:hypothetical protein [Bacteroidaceae bacterium]
MKKTYIIPALQETYMVLELPVNTSNEVGDNNAIELNPSTMYGGDGDDAVKGNSYNIWDDDWSR